MAFIDELKIYIKAGRGGDGVIRWRREKGRPRGGPSGGDGGNGGDVYVVADSDLAILGKYKHEKEFDAENGESGRNDSEKGKNGEDLKLRLPVGSIIKNLETDEEFELVKRGQEIKILQGGRGGLGNEYFKSSTNQNPFECTKGKIGEEADFFIELKLFADAGFIGLPNVGKSSLLNELTRAGAKVGNFQFTTLDPNLGAFYEFILADVPGLIEGASSGKGLGVKFLKHAERTKILLHCIASDSEDVVKDYKVVRKELESFNEKLAQKQEVIILTRTDMVPEKDLKEKVKKIKKLNENIFTLSVYDDESIKNFSDNLTKILRNK
jgi:GTP-binding protein